MIAYSMSDVVLTFLIGPSGIVQNISISNGSVTRTSAELEVSFEPLLILQRNGIVLQYVIRVTNTESNETLSFKMVNITSDQAEDTVMTVRLLSVCVDVAVDHDTITQILLASFKWRQEKSAAIMCVNIT